MTLSPNIDKLSTHYEENIKKHCIFVTVINLMAIKLTAI